MKRFSRALVASFGFVVLGSVISLVPQKSATGSNTKSPTGGHIENVNVVNTPLPVSGTVNVGTPTVNLGAGSTVGINGSVQIGNSATSPVLVRDVDNPARQPFTLSFNIPIRDNDSAAFASLTLETGRRFVILSVSVAGFVKKGTNTNWFASVLMKSSGGVADVGVSFPVPNVLPGFGGGVLDLFGATQPVYITPDPGTAIEVGIQRIGITGAGDIRFTLTGYSVAE